MCESLMDAWFAMKQTDPRARAVWGGRWVVSPDEFRHETAVGAYTKATAIEEIDSSSVILVCDDHGTHRAYRWVPVSGGGELHPTDLPEVPDADCGGRRRTTDAFICLTEALRRRGFVQDIHPLSLGDLADALRAEEISHLVHEHRVMRVVRGRSSFSFHEFEAFTGAGPLADRDAAAAVAQLRDCLETSSVVVAERWGRHVRIDMSREIATWPDPSPTGEMTFSSDAHILADWLQLTVRELAEGRGQLAVLAHAVAEDTELIEDPADGALVPARPATRYPWTLYLADRGKLESWRLAV